MSNKKYRKLPIALTTKAIMAYVDMLRMLIGKIIFTIAKKHSNTPVKRTQTKVSAFPLFTYSFAIGTEEVATSVAIPNKMPINNTQKSKRKLKSSFVTLI